MAFIVGFMWFQDEREQEGHEIVADLKAEERKG
jgi:hypothetical protein